MSRNYDNHTLYVNSGVATKEQLTAAIHASLKTASRQLNRPITTAFKVNVVVVQNNYVGYSYVRVQNKEVYNMLVGRNPDGTERVQWLEDPNWKPPTEVKEPSTSSSWADLMDEEDELEPPQIRQLLPPLMTLPPYRYNKEQLKHVTALLEEKQDKLGLSEPVKVSPFGHFEVSRSYVTDIDEERFIPNILCSRNVPLWITEKDLKEVFSAYASDIVTKHQRKVNGRIVQETYPFVTINAGRVAFITFSPANRDAQFALLMTRKLELTSRDLTKKVQLVFSHAFRN